MKSKQETLISAAMIAMHSHPLMKPYQSVAIVPFPVGITSLTYSDLSDTHDVVIGTPFQFQTLQKGSLGQTANGYRAIVIKTKLPALLFNPSNVSGSDLCITNGVFLKQIWPLLQKQQHLIF